MWSYALVSIVSRVTLIWSISTSIIYAEYYDSTNTYISLGTIRGKRLLMTGRYFDKAAGQPVFTHATFRLLSHYSDTIQVFGSASSFR